MTNGYKALIIILVISIILTLSGCVSKSKENNIVQVPGNNTTNIPNNDTEKVQGIINVLIPTSSSTYEDDKFMAIVKEANDIIDNNNLKLTIAIQIGDLQNIEMYGKNLELNATRYMSILKGLTISPKFEKMYSAYYNYLENMNKTGQHIQESARQYKSMDTDSCNNPYSYKQQM